jgi:hypothetical protein
VSTFPSPSPFLPSLPLSALVSSPLPLQPEEKPEWRRPRVLCMCYCTEKGMWGEGRKRGCGEGIRCLHVSKQRQEPCVFDPFLPSASFVPITHSAPCSPCASFSPFSWICCNDRSA